jgi:ring-1,2-phenylacetyl-CoA epoxidase subunit PaaD
VTALRNQRGITDSDFGDLCAAVAAVVDPEIPVLTIDDLGVLRKVVRTDDGVVVTITPTYSGCPAMHYIEAQIVDVLSAAGVSGRVQTVWSPAWTTDWMSDEARRKLREYGIAPPMDCGAIGAATVSIRPSVKCPRCGSTSTSTVSEFGSTACKALYTCRDCLEPFDYFKEL